VSHWYANCRVLSQSIAVQEKTAKFVVQFLVEHTMLARVDAVLGVPEGASSLGTVVHAQLVKKGIVKDKLYVFRKKPKEHGDPINRFWVTGQSPKKVIVLEDVTTTGASALAYIEALELAGVQVKALVSLINRELISEGKTVAEHMQSRGIRYASLLHARDVLPVVLRALPQKLQSEARAYINAEYTEEYAPLAAPFTV
jgi:orotate phosphoribosyltransferase